MDGVLYFIKTNNEIIALAAIGLSGAALFLLFVNTWRTGKLIKNYKQMMHGMGGKNLEAMLYSHLEHVNRVRTKTTEVENAYKALRKMAENSIQNVGVVRFNAFDDTGSDLSFAVALLNHHGDGLIFSSLFGRNETRTYAKPVSNGTSSYHLSEEEEEAIRRAMEGGKQ